jgi:hypothetical protein
VQLGVLARLVIQPLQVGHGLVPHLDAIGHARSQVLQRESEPVACPLSLDEVVLVQSLQ